MYGLVFDQQALEYLNKLERIFMNNYPTLNIQ